MLTGHRPLLFHRSLRHPRPSFSHLRPWHSVLSPVFQMLHSFPAHVPLACMSHAHVPASFCFIGTIIYRCGLHDCHISRRVLPSLPSGEPSLRLRLNASTLPAQHSRWPCSYPHYDWAHININPTQGATSSH